MVTTTPTNALKTYEAYLYEIGSQYDVLVAFSRARDNLARALDWTQLDHAQKAATTIALKNPLDVDRLFPAAFISIHAGFEQFLRDLIEEICLSISNSGVSCKNISAKAPNLKAWNQRMTGRALATVFEPVEYWRINFDELSKQISSFVDGSNSVILNGRALAIRDENLTPDKLDKYLGRLGLTLNWADICNDKDMQTALDAKNKTQGGQKLQSYLDDAVKKRNKLAHSQGATIAFSYDEVTLALKIFRKAAIGIEKQSRDHADTLKKP